MGVTLFDLEDFDRSWGINFWHWRAIAAAVHRLDVLPEDVAEGLQEFHMNNGLSKDQARDVARHLRKHLLTTLEEEDRLLLDGETTKEPDDGTFYPPGPEVHKNYSTNAKVLESFIEFCESCNGFRL